MALETERSREYPLNGGLAALKSGANDAIGAIARAGRRLVQTSRAAGSAAVGKAAAVAIALPGHVSYLLSHCTLRISCGSFDSESSTCDIRFRLEWTAKNLKFICGLIRQGFPDISP